jgi:hypothetical protein
MNSKAVLSLLCVTLLSGCATPIQYFSSKPTAGQKLVAIPPQKTTFGSREIKGGIHSEVLFEPTAGNKLFNGTAVFWIYTKNLDTDAFRFGPGDISVVDENGKPVKMTSPRELVTKLQSNKSKQEWGFILASSILSALSAAPYLTNQQMGTYSGYTTNGQYVQGTYVGTTTNKTVEYMAQQENTVRIDSFSDQMNAALNRALTNVQRLSLTDNNLEGGMSVQGIIAVPLPNSLPNRYKFIIRTTGATFEHSFQISKTN